MHHLALYERDDAFAAAVDSADAWTADGWPVKVLFGLVGRRVRRATGSDLCRDLVQKPQALPGVRRIALIGASAEAGERFGSLLDHADRALVLTEHGRSAEWDAVLLTERLRKARPDLVVVAVTPPAGEIVAAALREAGLPAWVIGVGGGIDMVTGLQPHTPRILRRVGGEWLWRLVHDPRRLFRRYILQCLPVVVRAPATVREVRRRPSDSTPRRVLP